MVRMHKSCDSDDKRNLQLICGALFFGVPGQGMEVASLKDMVQDTPHKYTLSLLDGDLGFQLRNNEEEDFNHAFKYEDFEIVHFFERKKSKLMVKVKKPNLVAQTFLTVVQDSKTGKYTRKGPEALLVPATSATYGRSWKPGSGSPRPFDRDHFQLVKFSEGDMDYDIVVEALQRLSQKANTIVETRSQKQSGMPMTCMSPSLGQW